MGYLLLVTMATQSTCTAEAFFASKCRSIMESYQTEVYSVCVNSEDDDAVREVAELYFETRDCDVNEDASDSPVDDSDSENGEEPDEDEEFDFDSSETDLSEKAKINTFYTNTCNCKLGESDQACSRSLSLSDFTDSRNNCHELSSTELDFVILGAIQSSLNCSNVSVSGRSEKNRKQLRMTFFYHGKRICRTTFLFLHCIGKNKFCSLVKHYRKNGLSLRVHGNKRRPPSWTVPSQAVEQVVKFILNVAEEQALLLPGRVPGFKRTDVRLLPSALTKHRLWMTYTEICTSQGQQSVGYSKFCDLWKQLCPFILIMRPATDLCWTCQKNNNLIQKSVNLPENQKVEAVRIQEEHLQLAAGERDFYKECCRESKESVQQHLREIDFTGRRDPCSYQGTVHYSYDYAQQLHYPADPLQPGPIYFKTPRKCAIFGVCCEAIPRQVNFLIDENVLTGKGANSTISYVHFYFQRHGLGETEAQIHADNCGAQNKNSAFIWYYLWRVMSDLHEEINYNFLLPGHTKFSPDWCFGLLKQKTRKTFISSLFDIARSVEESANVNVAELVGLHNGTVLVPTYDWFTYLGRFFKKLPNIKSFYHFRFHRDFPGTVFCKEYWNSQERAVNLLRNGTTLETGVLPPTISPSGISRERAEYLYKEIREFCRGGTEDLVAPPVPH